MGELFFARVFFFFGVAKNTRKFLDSRISKFFSSDRRRREPLSLSSWLLCPRHAPRSEALTVCFFFVFSFFFSQRCPSLSPTESYIVAVLRFSVTSEAAAAASPACFRIRTARGVRDRGFAQSAGSRETLIYLENQSARIDTLAITTRSAGVGKLLRFPRTALRRPLTVAVAQRCSHDLLHSALVQIDARPKLHGVECVMILARSTIAEIFMYLLSLPSTSPGCMGPNLNGRALRGPVPQRRQCPRSVVLAPSRPPLREPVTFRT